jgi:hypothetical protein
MEACVVYFDVLSVRFPRGTEEIHEETQLRIVDILADIRTCQLPNTSKNRYCLSQHALSGNISLLCIPAFLLMTTSNAYILPE